ncbi:hypothetical protein [Mesorhizobium sp.]|uniref:hypothetical protein n=1 Tax=Mesorhizobium sp. TaxID=1871066 RepID=UPI002580C02B|nr:hypothetical protein [Mesorhizobium sp.]
MAARVLAPHEMMAQGRAFDDIAAILARPTSGWRPLVQRTIFGIAVGLGIAAGLAFAG